MPADQRKIKVAAVQDAPVAFDLAATLNKAEGLVRIAAEGGAQLVVLPEAFFSAYPRHWGNFSIGSRTVEQREWYARYVESSVKVPENAVGVDFLSQYNSETSVSEEYRAFSCIAAMAKTNQVYLSVGIVERSLIGSTLYCTNILVSPKGILLAKHRKMQPTAAERVVWGQGEATYPVTASPSAQDELDEDAKIARQSAGDNMPVARTKIGAIGGMICWENYMPLARYALYKKGVEIYVAPTADARPTWLPTMQHIAQEGRCYVVSANQYHGAQDFPSDYPISSSAQTSSDPDAAWSRGGSCIVGPLGEVIAGPLWGERGILYAELDLQALHGARLDFDPVGHYSRGSLLMDMLVGIVLENRVIIDAWRHEKTKQVIIVNMASVNMAYDGPDRVNLAETLQDKVDTSRYKRDEDAKFDLEMQEFLKNYDWEGVLVDSEVEGWLDE